MFRLNLPDSSQTSQSPSPSLPNAAIRKAAAQALAEMEKSSGLHLGNEVNKPPCQLWSCHLLCLQRSEEELYYRSAKEPASPGVEEVGVPRLRPCHPMKWENFTAINKSQEQNSVGGPCALPCWMVDQTLGLAAHSVFLSVKSEAVKDKAAIRPLTLALKDLLAAAPVLMGILPFRLCISISSTNANLHHYKVQ